MSDDDMTQFLDLFIQESNDRFEELNRELVRLEDDPSNEERLYSILRHVHSLKGSAGMFGFDALKTLAHRLEDLMESVHARPETVNRDIMDVLFEGCDILQAMVRRISEGDPNVKAFIPRERAFHDHLESVIRRHAGGGGAGATPELVAKLDDQLREILPALQEVIDVSALTDTLQRLRRATAEETEEEGAEATAPAPGGSARRLLGEAPVDEPLARLSAALAKARAQGLDEAECEQVFADLGLILDAAASHPEEAVVAWARELRESVEVFHGLELDFDELQAQYFGEELQRLEPYLQAPPAEKDAGDANAFDGLDAEALETGEEDGEGLAEERRRERTEADTRVLSPTRKTVRIEDAKIDTFLDSVGELIILSEVFNNLQKRLAGVVKGHLELMREFKTINAAFAGQVFTLQEALMAVRRVELRNVTGSLARLVRDTARSLGKQVELIVDGEEAVLDKSLLDDVNTCLVHLVRNAVDHGIEAPDARAAKGKPPGGHIRVTAYNEDGMLHLRIQDDGKGVDTGALRAKAVALGLHTPESAEALSEREARRLLFSDGLSTARSVSDVSGRGVGMSAVLENINRMSGTVDVESERDKGTTIALRIPLSIMLSVVDGLTIRVAGTGFVIPIRHVLESFHPEPGQITRVQGKGECVSLRGRLFPLTRLRERFVMDDGPAAAVAGDHPADAATGASGIGATGVGVLVQSERGEVCLLADEVSDHQQVVIKEIEGLGKIDGILGGALMGDGTIGLVLDIDTVTART